MRALGIATILACFGGLAVAQEQSGQPYYPQQPQQPYGQQPYVQPQYGQPPPPQCDPNSPQYDPNAQCQYDQEQQAQAYDPNAQYPQDPYAADEQQQSDDVYYDNLAANGYDDGYDPNAYQQFESELSPYGTWYDDPSYGHVWVPSSSNVGYDFEPYTTGGHWVLTEYGWTWVSDYDWGWAPFHYGRWMVVGAYGWCWIPGTVWGPAWVSWRSGGGYVGWSPLPPGGFMIGPPRGTRSHWHFVVASQLGTSRMNLLPAHVVPTIFARTSVINNYRTAAVGGGTLRYNAGPHTLTGAGVGVSTPVRLSQVAPRALPRTTIAPRIGTTLSARPWIRAGVPGVSPRVLQRPATTPMPRPSYLPPASSHSVYSPQPRYVPPAQMRTAPTYPAPYRYNNAPPAYHGNSPSPQVHYNSPSPAYHYNTPAPTYHYNAPAPQYHYSAPTYHAPTYSAPHYSAPAPSYHAPATSYSRPSVAPAPHFSAPAHFGGRR
jgi:Family of unknown function (DUF6600)